MYVWCDVVPTQSLILLIALNDTRDCVVTSTLGDEVSLIRRTIIAISDLPTQKKTKVKHVNQGAVMQYLGVPVGRKSDGKKSSTKSKKGMNQGNISVSASS